MKGTTSINCNQSLSDLPSYPQRVRNELDNLMTEFDSSKLLTKRQRRSSASEVFESLRPSAVTQISLDKIVTLVSQIIFKKIISHHLSFRIVIQRHVLR